MNQVPKKGYDWMRKAPKQKIFCWKTFREISESLKLICLHAWVWGSGMRDCLKFKFTARLEKLNQNTVYGGGTQTSHLNKVPW